MKKRLSLAALLPGFLSLNSSETLANTVNVFAINAFLHNVESFT